MKSAVDDDKFLSSYHFDLPKDRIARRPLAKRSSSRLLHLSKDGGLHHRQFSAFPTLLEAGDVLVVNDTRVVPARLFGRKAETGGKVELVLCRKEADAHVALIGTNKKVKPGMRIVFGDDDPEALFFATVESQMQGEPGAFLVRFEGDPYAYAAAYGHIPLPPYLERGDDEEDRTRYQTVFAQSEGAAAAPTAGLHFDDDTLEIIRERGVAIAKVTLHTGPGTFLPVRTDNLDDHVMHKEPWSMSAEAASLLNARKGRVIAVGTTSLRVLEAAHDGERFVSGSGVTDLFVRPGHDLRAIDAILTNFHLPSSTLIVLAAAVVGRQRLLAAYREAIAEGYRFFSYGDATFLEVSK